MINFDFINDCLASLNTMRNDVGSMKNINILSDMIKEAILDNQTIYITGIGKPGYIAQKNAATLKSISLHDLTLFNCISFDMQIITTLHFGRNCFMYLNNT